MLLRSILFLCFILVLNGCTGVGGAIIGGLGGPITCAKKAIEDKDAGVLDYLKVPAALLFGPFVGISHEIKMGRNRGDIQGTEAKDRIKYIADVCDNRSKEEYFNALREQKKDDKRQEEEK